MSEKPRSPRQGLPQTEPTASPVPPAVPLMQRAADFSRRVGALAFPVIGKRPPQGYRYTERLTAQTTEPGPLEAPPQLWEQATGYALTPPPGSDLYFLDSDDQAFTYRLLRAFPQLREAPQIRSGRAGHCNFILRLTLDEPIRRLSLRDGGGEVGSLRGERSYILGAGSIHPDTRQPYTHNGLWAPPRLSAGDSDRLLFMFARPAFAGPPLAVWLGPRPPGAVPEATLQAITATLLGMGYRGPKDWLNGPCLFPEHHKHNDRHPSFGFNTTSGEGYCFVCGPLSAAKVAAALDIPVPPNASGASGASAGRAAPDPAEPVAFLPDTSRPRPFAFIDPPGPAPASPITAAVPAPVLAPVPTGPGAAPETSASEPPGRVIQTELNIATELVRRRRVQAARLYSLLLDHARASHGQHSYTLGEMIALGEAVGLSRSQVTKAAEQMVSLSLLKKLKHGRYQRVSIARARALLGLGPEYALVQVSYVAFRGTTRAFNTALMVEAGRRLPEGLAAATIADAAGRSRRTLYYHEAVAQVERQSRVRRVGLATATPASFVRVFDKDNRAVLTVDGEDLDGALERAAQCEGRVWPWSQRPSLRSYPDRGSAAGQEGPKSESAVFAHALAFAFPASGVLDSCHESTGGIQQGAANGCRRQTAAASAPEQGGLTGGTGLTDNIDCNTQKGSV